jgi:ABC-type glutathione transport system ATPase component
MVRALLEVSNLHVARGKAGAGEAILKGLTFEVSPGTIVGIIGESGAGKSTLALALTGLLDTGSTRTSGSVLFEGEDLLTLDEKALCQFRGSGIGMIFQDPSGALDPAMRIDRQIAGSIRAHSGMSRSDSLKASREVLERFGIGATVLDTAPYAHQLSGGLRQRAMITAALASEPALLVADEPTSALDVTVQSQIVEMLVSRCRDTGMAMLFISHDLALVSTFADELIVLHQGSIVERGGNPEILTAPRHPYTQELVAVWRRELLEGVV